jgi:hypothetical protein
MDERVARRGREEIWEEEGAEWRPRGAAAEAEEEEQRRRETERKRKLGRHEDEGDKEWEPRGRNELRAIRQNEQDRKARRQEGEDEASAGASYQRRESGETREKREKERDRLESRIEAIEKDRRYEKARSGLSTELKVEVEFLRLTIRDCIRTSIRW